MWSVGFDKLSRMAPKHRFFNVVVRGEKLMIAQTVDLNTTSGLRVVSILIFISYHTCLNFSKVGVLDNGRCCI